MTDPDIFSSKDRWKPEKEWQDLLSDYVDDLGVKELPGGMYKSAIQNHPVFYDAPGDMNWSSLMPDSSVFKLKNSENIYEDFVNIVETTAENIEQMSHNMPEMMYTKMNLSWDEEKISNTSIKPPDKAYIAGQILRRLSGAVNPHNPPSIEKETMAPPDNLKILVTMINDKNMEDWLIFDIKDSVVFDRCFQQSTHMFNILQKNDVEPEIKLQNVALDLNGVNVPGSPPKERISLVIMAKRRDHCEYTDIQRPEKVFKNDWGIHDQMIEILGDDIREDSFRLDWTISTGMRW